MATRNECEDYARDCVRLAGLTKDEYVSDALLGMAHEWMTEALLREQRNPSRYSRKAATS